MAEILEIAMIVSFGISWPLNAVKAYKAGSAKGASIMFLLLIFFGYICGIASKFSSEAYMSAFSEKWYVLVFYFINLITVSVNILIYIRNVRLDKKAK